MSSPKELYCLACRKRQPVVNVTKENIKFVSKKTKTEMSRFSWVGTCDGKRANGNHCGQKVRCFVTTKSDKPEFKGPESTTE